MHKECEYTSQQIADAFYDLYGAEMETSDGFREYTAFELLASLEVWSRKEILNHIAEIA